MITEETQRCDICTAPMTRISVHSVRSRIGTPMRKRKYKCTSCDYEKAIFGRGSRDEMHEEAAVIEAGNSPWPPETVFQDGDLGFDEQPELDPTPEENE